MAKPLLGKFSSKTSKGSPKLTQSSISSFFSKSASKPVSTVTTVIQEKTVVKDQESEKEVEKECTPRKEKKEKSKKKENDTETAHSANK
eukprot:Ihof_evm3s616 gene=Ihof_evmTU3s616